MKMTMFSLASAAVIASGFRLPCFGDTIPKVPFCKQEQKYWCWAASSQVILKFYVPGFSKTQSQIANTFGPNAGTINKDTLVKTKIPLLLQLNSVVNGIRYLDAEYLNRTLTWSEIKVMADSKLPFTIIYHYPSQTSTDMYHCVIYAGYINDSTRIKIVDPDMLNGTQTYEKSYKQLTTGNLATTCVWMYSVVPHRAAVYLAHPEFSNPNGVSLNVLHSETGIRFSIAGGRYRQKVGVTVMGLNGRIFWRNSIYSDRTIDLPWLSAGAYCIKTSDETLKFPGKLILSR